MLMIIKNRLYDWQEKRHREHSDEKRSSYRETWHIKHCIYGNIWCTNTLSAKAIGVTLKELRKSTQPHTCRPHNMGASNESSVVLYNAMHPWSHPWSHSRGKNAERSLRQTQEDFPGQHDRTQASTLSGVEQYSTKGYVDHQLHLEDQGVVWCPRIYQWQDRRWWNGVYMPWGLSITIWHNQIGNPCKGETSHLFWPSVDTIGRRKSRSTKEQCTRWSDALLLVGW